MSALTDKSKHLDRNSRSLFFSQCLFEAKDESEILGLWQKLTVLEDLDWLSLSIFSGRTETPLLSIRSPKSWISFVVKSGFLSGGYKLSRTVFENRQVIVAAADLFKDFNSTVVGLVAPSESGCNSLKLAKIADYMALSIQKLTFFLRNSLIKEVMNVSSGEAAVLITDGGLRSILWKNEKSSEFASTEILDLARCCLGNQKVSYFFEQDQRPFELRVREISARAEAFEKLFVLYLTPIGQKENAISALLEFRGLSPREIAVAKLILKGQSNAQIASDLFVSPETIKSHCRSIFEKLSIHKRAELVRLALSDG